MQMPIMSLRSTFVSVLLALTIGVLVISICAQEQRSDAPIKVQTTLVSVPVIVSDRQGRYISGLRVQDFKLYQDRAEQPISYFDAAEEPLSVALLIDTSKSTEPVLEDIKSAAAKFLKELRPQDRAIILTVDYDVHVLSQLTADRRALERAVKDAQTGAEFGTVLRDGVAQVIDQSFKHVDGRKAIVVLTDGKDVGSRMSENELLDEAAESGAMIYSVFFETMFARRGWIDPLEFPRRRVWRRDDGRYPSKRQQEQRRQRQEKRNEVAVSFLTKLSEVSAGRYYTSEAADLKQTFSRIAEELRHQYRLGFYPESSKADGQRHTLRVEVTAPDAIVRSRRSYQAANPAGGS